MTVATGLANKWLSPTACALVKTRSEDPVLTGLLSENLSQHDFHDFDLEPLEPVGDLPDDDWDSWLAGAHDCPEGRNRKW